MARLSAGIARARSPALPSQTFLHHAVIAAEGCADIVIERKPAIRQNCPSVAILAERLRVVRHQDDIGPHHPFAECLRAFATKALVADLSDLVYQIDVEIDGEAGRKGE